MSARLPIPQYLYPLMRVLRNGSSRNRIEHMRRLLSTDAFDGLDGLVERLQQAELFARINNHGTPAVEFKTLPVDRTLRPVVALYEETLSDKSTQLVAVVIG